MLFVEIFGDYGVWKSPGGKSKEFINDQIKATWHDSKSLILKGDIGERIKGPMIQELEANHKSQAIRNNCY